MEQETISKAWAEDIARACDVMRKGGVILYPTDTVWGIGCDATNEAAVRRIFDIKRRADAKAMLVLVDSANRVSLYARDVPDVAWDLIELSERPLTLIYDGARNLAPSLIAEDGSIGIRATKEPFSRHLCYRFSKAIVSTSANISKIRQGNAWSETPLYSPGYENTESGHNAYAVFDDICDEIRSAVDYVCTSRRNEKAPQKPSSIIKISANGEFRIIR